jgi:phosphatidylserine/phosphatidylglycerophosphate/cardiolipin synthase-like enzyme
MTRFLFGDLLWKAIASRAKKAHRKKAAIAYVTKEGPLSFKPGDVLIVDASDKAISFGETSAAVMGTLLKRGVRLYSHIGLHSKIVIVDSVLFASSANLSESSLSRLFEAGIETDNPNAVSGAVGMVERLCAKSVPIDAKFVARISKIVVVKGSGATKSSVRTTPRGHREPVTWLMGIHDIEEPKDPDELGVFGGICG